MRLHLLAAYLPCSSRRAGHVWLAAVLVLSSVWLPMAHAQQSPTLDRLDIGIGAYYATSDTTVGASIPEGFAAASINLENDLGLDNRGLSARIRADVLIGDHQGLSFDYYRYNRNNAQTWQRAVDWQGVVHDIHAKLDGKLAFAFGSVAWRWWFGSGDNVIGLGLGASHYRASASFVGNLQVDGKVYDFDERTGAGAWAPLLQVGWRHMFSPQWRMYFSGAGVFKNGGKLQGHIYNASLGVEWLPMRRLGFAVEYGINSIHIKQSHEHYRDSLDLELNGPSAFVYLRF